MAQTAAGAKVHAQRPGFTPLGDADARRVYAADAAYADCHLGLEGVGAGLLHLPAAGDDRGQHLGIEQPAPNLCGRDVQIDAPLAFERAAAERPVLPRLALAGVGAGARQRRAVGQLPDAVERKRQFDVLAPERIGGGIGKRGGREHGTAVAHAFGAGPVRGRGRRDVADREFRHLRRGRAKIFREGAGDEVAGTIVHQFLVQRRAEPVGEAAVNLPLDDHRIEHRAHIVDRNVFHDLHPAGRAVELDRGEIGDKAIGHG